MKKASANQKWGKSVTVREQKAQAKANAYCRSLADNVALRMTKKTALKKIMERKSFGAGRLVSHR